MFQVTINEKGGLSRDERFDKEQVNIGRVQGNDIILPKGNISKRHSRLVLKDGKAIIVDLKSTNGTYVNGKKITQPQVVKPSDKIYIGDFTLQVVVEEARAPAPEQEIDVFGGAARAPSAISSEPAPAPAPAPALVDDHLDQEFPQASADVGSVAPAAADNEIESQIEAELNRLGSASSPDAPRSDAGPMTTMRPESLFATGIPAPAAPVAVAAAGAVPLTRAEAARQLHVEVVEALGLRGVELAALPALRDEALSVARRLATQLKQVGALAAGEDEESLAEEVAQLATNVQLILDLMREDAVVEIAITHDRQVLADREGRLDPIDRVVQQEAQVVQLIRTLGVLGGVNPGPGEPLVDVRLRDGCRVLASLPPLAFRGPSLSIRKSSRDFFTLDKLREYETVSAEMLTLLDYCVRYRQNLLLSVGSGVSPTATLNALLAQIPEDDRVVTIERGIELHVGVQRSVTALEPQADITASDLIDFAVASQADRLVSGMLPAEDLATAMDAAAGPLEGSIFCVEADNPAAALERMERELAWASSDDEAAARRKLASTVSVVLQEDRFLDNSRRLTAISELVVGEGGEVEVKEIFRFVPEGLSENLIITGRFEASGHVPSFLRGIADRGEAEVDLGIFSPSAPASQTPAEPEEPEA